MTTETPPAESPVNSLDSSRSSCRNLLSDNGKMLAGEERHKETPGLLGPDGLLATPIVKVVLFLAVLFSVS